MYGDIHAFRVQGPHNAGAHAPRRARDQSRFARKRLIGHDHTPLPDPILKP